MDCAVAITIARLIPCVSDVRYGVPVDPMLEDFLFPYLSQAVSTVSGEAPVYNIGQCPQSDYRIGAFDSRACAEHDVWGFHGG